MPIIGNVNPIEIMMFGTPEDVRENVMNNIYNCADASNGYFVATGCDMPVATSHENALAFMDAVREFGSARLGVELPPRA